MSCFSLFIVCKFFRLNRIMDGFVNLFIKVQSYLIVAVQIVNFFYYYSVYAKYVVIPSCLYCCCGVEVNIVFFFFIAMNH